MLTLIGFIMKKKYGLVFSTLMILMSLPASAHVGFNADHSSVKNLLVHLMGFDHVAFLIGLGLCVYVFGQLLMSMLMRVSRKNQRKY